ncbi:hypothetical protein BH09PSE2_BH09PSE2_13880 [soil metagenome]
MLADHVPGGFIAVDDMAAAVAFYGGVLGLEDHGFDGFAHRFRAGPVNLRIVKPPQGALIADYTVMGWETPDIARDVAALTARGVAFKRYPFFGLSQDQATGVWTAPDGAKVAWFNDPAGNVLSLAQHV